MKKNILWSVLMVAFALGVSSCKDEGGTDVETVCNNPAAINLGELGKCIIPSSEQKSIFVKFTGTWCFACGDYGAKMVHEIHVAYPDNGIILEAHKGSDPMNNQVVKDWKAYWPHTSTPSFVANDQLLSGYPISPAKAVIDAMNKKAPTAGLAVDYKNEGGNMKGKAYVKALADLDGEYNLAVYLVGDGFVYKQIGKDGTAHPEWEFDGKNYPEYIHTSTLRDELNGESFGSQIIKTSLKKGKSASIDFDYTIPSKITESVRLVLVMWKVNGAKYEFVNATKE